MLISFRCPHCDNKLLAGEYSVGKQVTCKCGWPVTVPEAVPDASPLPAYLQEPVLLPVPPPAAETSADTDLPSYLQAQPLVPVELPAVFPELLAWQIEPPQPGPKLSREPEEPPPQKSLPVPISPAVTRTRPRSLTWTTTAALGAGIVGLSLVLVLLLRPRLQKQDAEEHQDQGGPAPAGQEAPSAAPVGRAKALVDTPTQDNVQQALERGLKLTGTVTATMHSEPLEGNTPWTCLRWQVDLTLANNTPWPLELGTDFLLYEANSNLSLFEGVALFRGLEAKPPQRRHLMPLSLAEPYGLSHNFQTHFTSGAHFLRRGNRLLRDNKLEYLEDGRVLPSRGEPPSFSPDSEDPRSSFGRLSVQQTRAFKLILDQGAYLPENGLRSRVQIVLPELTLVPGHAVQARLAERYRAVAHLQKTPQDPNVWQVIGLDLLKVESGELARLVESPATNAITRICAANWLMETAPERGRESLVRAGSKLPDGPLLLTCLQLLDARQGTGLEEHALRLLQDPRTAAGLRSWSALYLGVLRYQPGFSSLVRLAHEAQDPASSGAIYALGAYGPQGSVALLDLLRIAPTERTGLVGLLVAENLVHTGARSPALFETLWELVEKDNRLALLVLVNSGYSETFAHLQKRARTERRPNWKGALAAGLLETGGDRAIPDVLEMLRKDEPPPENEILQQDDLVRSVQPFYSANALVGLLELAREGNLRAVQVLTGIPHDAALPALVGIARTGPENQVFIALDGLARRWPKQSLPAFRDALKHPNKFIVLKAIEELGDSGEPAVAGWLTPFRDNKDQDLRTAAERALARLTGNKPTP